MYIFPEAQMTEYDRRVCLSIISFPIGDCRDDTCESACNRQEDEVGERPIHVCLNGYKCCCNYDEARNLVTPYD